MKIRCKYCGKAFEHHNYCKKYCSPECSTEARRKRGRQYWKKEQEERNKKDQSKISEINRLARDAGMTYGKYVAMKYIEEQKNAGTMQELPR